MVAPGISAIRLLANVSRRVVNLKKHGLTSSATVEFEAIKQQFKNGLLNGSETVKAVRALERSGALHVKTAGKVVRRESRENFLKKVAGEAWRGANSTVSRADMVEYQRIMANRLKSRVRYLKSKGLDGTDAVTKALDVFKQLKDVDVGSLNMRSMRRLTMQLDQLSTMSGLTAKGARHQLMRETRLFGSQAQGWTREQKSAVWRALEREFELNAMRWSSDQVLAIMTEVPQSEYAIKFHTVTSAYDGKTQIEAEFGLTAGEASRKVDMAKVQEKLISKMLVGSERIL